MADLTGHKRRLADTVLLFDHIVTIENYYRGLLFSVFYFTLAGAIGGLMSRFIKAKNKADNRDNEV